MLKNQSQQVFHLAGDDVVLLEKAVSSI